MDEKAQASMVDPGNVREWVGDLIHLNALDNAHVLSLVVADHAAWDPQCCWMVYGMLQYQFPNLRIPASLSGVFVQPFCLGFFRDKERAMNAWIAQCHARQYAVKEWSSVCYYVPYELQLGGV